MRVVIWPKMSSIDIDENSKTMLEDIVGICKEKGIELPKTMKLLIRKSDMEGFLVPSEGTNKIVEC